MEYRIANLNLDENGRAILAKLIRSSYASGDAATLIAAIRSLGRTSQGRDDLANFGLSSLGARTRLRQDPETMRIGGTKVFQV